MSIALEARPNYLQQEPQLPPPTIDGALANARDIFVANNRGRERKMTAYELAQDRAVYRELAKHKGEEGYEAARDSLNAYTKMQIETHIGERLHVGISKFNFPIKDGQLMAENAEESMLNMMKRGRDYRRDHGLEVDFARESAEVYGFEEIEEVMVDKQTPEGYMMLSLSHRGDVKNGSIYGQNFYDVFIKTKTGVEGFRYTSGLTPAESQAKVRKFDLRYARDEVPDDVQFLSRPIRLDPKTTPFKTPNDVHEYMHKDHKFKSEEEFNKIIEICMPMIMAQINSLCNNPDDIRDHEEKERILLNAVDEVEEKIARGEVLVNPRNGDKLYVRPWVPTTADIDRLIGKPVRVVATGCGSSTGSGSFGSAYSVAESAGDKEYSGENAKDDPNLCKCNGGAAHFHCPGMKEIEGTKVPCRKAIVVGEGTSSCPDCKSGKIC